MESGMLDCGFSRCDGHHKMIDFRLEKSSGFLTHSGYSHGRQRL